MRTLHKILILLFTAFPLLNAAAQNTGDNLDHLEFKLMVIGASDEIFIWWGHAALIVDDTRFNYARVYDWGIFSYPSDSFLMDWIRDKVAYKCAVSYAQADINMYTEEDRDVVVYVLDLDSDKKQAILDYANHKVLPENCYYTYHPFKDNCATSIRDLIDLGTGGQLREAFADAPGRFTFRQHLRRYIWFRTFADGFYSFLMGQDLDKPLTAWEEMFLPVEIGRNIADFTYTDNSGYERNLVTRVEILNATKNRKPILDAPLSQWPLALFIATAVTVLLSLAVAYRKKNPGPGRILWGFSQCIAGIILGVFGTVLFFVMFFMKHDYFMNNLNLLLVNPLYLAALPLGVAVMAKRPGPEKILRIWWTFIFAADILLMASRLLPVFYQHNFTIQVMMFPVSFVLSWNFDTHTSGVQELVFWIFAKLKKING